MYQTNIWLLSISSLKVLLICILFAKVNTLSDYDRAVLRDIPVGYWPLEPNIPYDYSGNNLTGTFVNSVSTTNTPNGDDVSIFNGINQYFTVADSNYLEIVRTGILTIEAWLRPDTLQFEDEEGTGYVWWIGKGITNGQNWAIRMYSYNNTEARFNRIGGYAFNRTGGNGIGSYFQDNLSTGEWILVTFIINTVSVSNTYPAGYTKIFKNGIYRDKDSLVGIVPENSVAPMRIATRQLKSFFRGAIGKVAIYDYELTPDQIQTHFNCMTKQINCI